jgi:lipoate-protein ligase A
MWIDDEIMARCQEKITCQIWPARETFVVLGSSNRAERECKLSACQQDGIPVLKRYGGGGTVLLYPGVVVVSLGIWVRQLYHNRHYFELLNGALIAALAQGFPECARLVQRGLSDIADGPRKVAGTSLFRSRHYLLYQVSILVNADVSLIERYIAHPSIEPEYREKKSHRDFLRCLSEIDSKASCEQVKEVLQEHFVSKVEYFFGNELLEPDPHHCAYLLGKAVSL